MDKHKTYDEGYRKRRIPPGAAYCVYCHGVGCGKCNDRGYYFPDLVEPTGKVPRRMG